MKKVLIITYYWPPSGGAGVQRWLKFVKYLPQNGWMPIIYTPQNPEAPADDPTLLEEIPRDTVVLKRKIWEPFSIYKKMTGKSADSKFNAGFLEEEGGGGFMKKLSIWIRGNLFIPDAKRFWIRPSVTFLKKYLKNNPVDLIVSTGPPHSLHVIAEKVKRKTGLPWLADFRDPWTQIDFYDKLQLSRFADAKHKKLEKKVLNKADRIVVVGKTMAEEFNAITAREISVITNGFDKDDIKTDAVDYPERFSIVHVGSINADRNHLVFWEALKNCINKKEGFKKDLELVFVGRNDVSVTEAIKTYGLENYVTFIPYIPHNEVFDLEKRAALLYLPINNTPNAKGILTGKFFEYLASERPILAIGPADGDLAKILKESGAGKISDFADREHLEQSIVGFYEAFKNKRLFANGKDLQKFERSELTKKMVEQFESLA